MKKATNTLNRKPQANMFTIEAERDGLQEQTLKKCVLQGKIRLTVNIKKKILNVEEEEERKK